MEIEKDKMFLYYYIDYMVYLIPKFSIIYLIYLLAIKLISSYRSAQRYKGFTQKRGNFLFGNLFEVLPIFGDKTHLVRSTLDHYVTEYHNSGYAVFWLSWFPVIGVVDYAKTQEILAKPSILDKGFPFEYLRYCIGDGILNSSASKWKERKRMIRPKFTAISVSNFVPMVQLKVRQLSIKLSTNYEGVPIDLTKIIPITSLSILMNVTLGIDLEESTLVSVEASLSSFIKNTLFRSINPFLWPDWSYDLYARLSGLKGQVDFVKKIVTDAVIKHLRDKESRKLVDRSTGVDYRAALDEPIMVYLLDQLLREPGLSVEEAIAATVEEIETLFIAGFDGPNNALVWLIYVLGLHSEIQEKIYNEISDIDEKTIDLNVIKSWTYIEQCVKEILRLFPPAPIATRVVTKDEPFDGKIIPANTFIFFSIYSIHRDPEIYPDPVKFDPERFNQQSASTIPQGSYIPFGLRPRDCIGQRFAMVQMKLIIALIVKHFRIHSSKPVSSIGQEIDFTLKPTEPLISIFHQRNNNQL